MNKIDLYNPETGKWRKVWSLDAKGLLANGWTKDGPQPEPKEKPKPRRTYKKPKEE